MSLSARVQRARNNALVVTYSDQDGADVAVGRQKSSATVLLGLKYGGKAACTIEGGATRLDVAVPATTRVSRNGTALGSIVGQGSSARAESATAHRLSSGHRRGRARRAPGPHRRRQVGHLLVPG